MTSMQKELVLLEWWEPFEMVAFDFVDGNDDDWAANEPLVIRGWLDVSQFMIFCLARPSSQF